MKKRWIICACLAFCFATPVWAQDTYIEIEATGWAVDSLNGIEAIYSLEANADNDPLYSCAAYVKKYYLNTYGVEVMNLYNDGPPLATGGATLVQADEPVQGDIIFWPLKDNANNHSAIVKEFDGETITLIEQNYKYDGKAVFERQIPFPGQGYEIWRLSTIPAELQRAENQLNIPGAEETGSDIPVVETAVKDLMEDHYFSLAEQTSFTKTFQDVPENHWAYGAIAKMSGWELLNGYEDNTFRPEHNITRAEFAVVLSKVTGYTGSYGNETSFKDVKAEDWFLPYVEYTKSKIFGDYYEDGSAYFRPNDPLTRQELCAAVALWKGYIIAFDDMPLQGFSDKEDIDLSYMPYVAACVQTGALSGFQDGTIRAREPVTRAQLSSMMSQLYKAGE